MKKTLLRKVSKKRVRHNLEYQKAKREYMKDHEICERCGYYGTLTLHHKASRGVNLSNVKYFAALCMLCHSWCHQFPKLARDSGWLLDKFNPENLG